MINLSVSNIGFSNSEILNFAQNFEGMGILGMEIAPTKIWGVLDDSKFPEIRTLKTNLADLGVEVSGLQSLFFGHPELQILNKSYWSKIHRHLLLMFEIANLLGLKILVFGSPKNRTRGGISQKDADLIATEFFQSLLSDLRAYDLKIALEPNATEYGADYLTTYKDVIHLEKLIGSDRIGVQIDTGCLHLAQIDIVEAVYSRDPIHVHISAPHLISPIAAPMNFDEISTALRNINYEGWIVLEMLEPADFKSVSTLQSAQWFVDTFKNRFLGSS